MGVNEAKLFDKSTPFSTFSLVTFRAWVAWVAWLPKVPKLKVVYGVLQSKSFASKTQTKIGFYWGSLNHNVSIGVLLALLSAGVPVIYFISISL